MRVKTEEEIIIEACRGEDYKKILENGTPEQQYKLAKCVENAFMYSKLINLSMKLYKKAADAGHVKAAFRYYINIQNKQGKSALKYLKFAAEKGYMEAKLTLARCYVYKFSKSCKKTNEAKKGFEIAKGISNKEAYHILAWCYEAGIGTDIDLEKAKKYYTILSKEKQFLLLKTNIDRIDMLIRERDKPNKKTREMIVKNFPTYYTIVDDKLVAL